MRDADDEDVRTVILPPLQLNPTQFNSTRPQQQQYATFFFIYIFFFLLLLLLLLPHRLVPPLPSNLCSLFHDAVCLALLVAVFGAFFPNQIWPCLCFPCCCPWALFFLLPLPAHFHSLWIFFLTLFLALGISVNTQNAMNREGGIASMRSWV